MANLSHFGLLFHACGFSQEDGERFLGVRKNRIRQWIYGKALPPQGVMEDLEKVWKLISLRLNDSSFFQETASRSDEEAQNVGWPCLSVERRFQELLTARAFENGVEPPVFKLVA